MFDLEFKGCTADASENSYLNIPPVFPSLLENQRRRSSHPVELFQLNPTNYTTSPGHCGRQNMSKSPTEWVEPNSSLFYKAYKACLLQGHPHDSSWLGVLSKHCLLQKAPQTRPSTLLTLCELNAKRSISTERLWCRDLLQAMQNTSEHINGK